MNTPLNSFDGLLKTAEAQQLSANIINALRQGDTESLNKYASGMSELLMFYTYTQGQMRRIFTGLTGESIDIVTQGDTNITVQDVDNERIKVRLFVQPEYLKIDRNAAPIQPWGAPFMARVQGTAFEGYFSRISSDLIEKHVNELTIYPYDILEFFKEQTVKQNLELEDITGYSGFYGLVRECETLVGPGSSILCTTQTLFNETANKYILDLFALHASARKRRQPREFVIVPEVLFLQFGKIPQTEMNGLSRQYFDTGFGDKNATPLYETKAMRVDDDTYLTCSDDPLVSRFAVVDGATALAKQIARYQAFGYNMFKDDGNLPTTDAELDELMSGRYGVTPSLTPYFRRMIVLPPRNFLGKMMAWGQDIKTVLEYSHSFVNFYSEEYIAFLLHNKYAVSCLDVWTDRLL